MPIVIEDMTVSVEINQPAQGTGASAASGSADAGGSNAAGAVNEQIRRCVEEVMEVMRQQNER